MIALLLTLAQVTSGPPRMLDCGAGADRARASLRAADTANARKKWRTADHFLEQGLKDLGTSYRQPAVIDDSGLHLVVAAMNARKSKFAQAVAIRRDVLVERLRFCSVRSNRGAR